MAADKLLERFSFAAGEIGRAQRARPDLARYQVAVAEQENYVTMPEGGATRAPGTKFVLELKDQSEIGRLIPWRRTAEDNYTLVFNGNAIRFVRAGGFVLNPGGNAPYQIASPFAAARLRRLRAATPSTGDKLYVVDGQRFVTITREELAKWKLRDFEATFGPFKTQNLDEDIKIQASAVEGKNIGLAARGGNVFRKDHEGLLFRLDDRDLSLTAQWSPFLDIKPGEIRRWAGNVYKNINPRNTSTGQNPPVHTEGTELSGKGSEGKDLANWEYLHSGYGIVKILRFIDGRNARGAVTKRLPETVVSGFTYRWWEPAWNDTDGYPDVICFASPRLALFRGGEFWLSSDFDPEDFEDTGEDDGAIIGRLRSPDGSLVDVQWALPAGPLVVGSSDMEWVLRGTPNLFDSLTMKTIKPSPEGDDGSIAQNPVRVDGGIMFIGRNGKRLHFARFSGADAGSVRLESDEISVWARHIFESGVTAYAWQRDPNRILWLVLNDGTLAGITFMPKQQMLAFHRHPRTNAFFEDIAVMPGADGGVDEVYFIVRRTITGATRRYVEQLADFFEPIDKNTPTAIGAWFLDCALRYQGAAKKHFSNLTHLAGLPVGVLADGVELRGHSVNAAGVLTPDLAKAAADVVIGIPIVARIKDLPRNPNTPADSTKAQEKMIYRGVFDFLFTGAGRVRVVPAPDAEIAEEDELAHEFQQVIENAGRRQGKPILFSGTRKINIDHEINLEPVLEIVNDDAMPCTLLSMSPRVAQDGDD